MKRVNVESSLVAALLVLAATPAQAQYRRQIEEPTPLWAVSAALGGLLPYEETLTPIETPDPEQVRRGRNDVGFSPTVAAMIRYGRGIAVYAHGLAAFPGQAERSGTDPLTGAPRSGEEEVGLITIIGVGLSFAPLSAVSGLRIELGPSWLDLGNGGDYVAARIAASAHVFELGPGEVVLGWDSYFAGGQHDRDEVERQLTAGFVNGVRLGYELPF